MTTTGDIPVIIRHIGEPHDFKRELAADVMSGLTGIPKAIPSRYFYDARGSALFEDITRLPEYYLTRAETQILTTHSDDIMAIAQPHEIIELGSGYSTKTKLLIEAMFRSGHGSKYLPIDISEDALREAAEVLSADYPDLEIEGLVGDFNHDLPEVAHSGRRMVVFLGSTIGNLDYEHQRTFVHAIAESLDIGDHFLVGMDLVKDRGVLLDAYNDSQGVTANFTRNVLHVINRELDANFPADDFIHRPLWNEELTRIEAWLESPEAMTIHIGDLNLDVTLDKGEQIHTEISRKFTLEAIDSLFNDTAMDVVEVFTDVLDRFALVLATPALRKHG